MGSHGDPAHDGIREPQFLEDVDQVVDDGSEVSHEPWRSVSASQRAR